MIADNHEILRTRLPGLHPEPPGASTGAWPARSARFYLTPRAVPGGHAKMAPVLQVHAYVEVSDLALGVAFYTAGLGLREHRRFTERWVELTGAAIPVHLLARPEPSFRAGELVLSRSFSRHWTPVHLDLIVDDLPRALERALAAGATLDRDPVDHHYWRMANLADPFGNGVDLIEFANGGYAAWVADRTR